jgi:phosphoglycerate dehydrogenase-like enzyme
MTQALRILLSPQTRQLLAPAIGQLMGKQPYELLTVAEAADPARGEVDAAFISRDVTGSSTKQLRTPDSEAFYDVLRRAKALKWVHIHSAGADRTIYTELHQRGVQICTSSGANAEVVAQTALAGVLALARQLPQLMAAQQTRTWAPLVSAPPRDLAGQTAVVVGWGPIGQRIGAFLRLLGLRLVVIRHSATPADPSTDAATEMVNFAGLPEVLPRADWLVLACPLTEQTRGLVNRDLLRALPAGARLINVARGEVVVEHDLIEFLQQGGLGGALLDVFEHEPLGADSPLWGFERVMVTPHSAGHSDGNYRRVADMFLANLARWLAAQPLQNTLR